jgi:hypothetical protein
MTGGWQSGKYWGGGANPSVKTTPAGIALLAGIAMGGVAGDEGSRSIYGRYNKDSL